MSEPIRLKDTEPKVDREAVGISYSGGGPLVLIELGCARAFIEKKIVPRHIAGVSAGALAGAAHAMDPVSGRGIDLAVEVLSSMRASTLGFGFWPVFGRLIRERQRFTSLADHAAIVPLIRDGVTRYFGEPFTIGHFGRNGLPALHVAATNRLDGSSYWFGPEVPLEQALLASSSIPGVFPWQTLSYGGAEHVLVDGGVVTNQPISELVLSGCGTLFVCAVGYAGETVAGPTNAVNNILPSIYMAIHQTMKLEEEYVRLKLGDTGVVHHIHPEIKQAISGYDFSREQVLGVIEESRQLTYRWLSDELHL